MNDMIFDRVPQYKQFQGSKKKARRRSYEERKKHKHWNANEMSRVAAKIGMTKLAKDLGVTAADPELLVKE